MYRMYPNIECLQIHLPNTHRVRFKRDQMIAEVLDNDRNKRRCSQNYFIWTPLIQKQGTIYTENSLSIIVGLVTPKHGDEDVDTGKFPLIIRLLFWRKGRWRIILSRPLFGESLFGMYMCCVCGCEGNTCVCVCVCVCVCKWAQIWSRHQSWEI